MNRQMVQGNLVGAASISTNSNGRDTLRFTVASNEGRTSDGKDITEYFPVVVHGAKGFADNIKEYLGKGAGVSVLGRKLSTRNEKDNAVYTNVVIELPGLRNLTLVGGKVTNAATDAARPAPEGHAESIAAAEAAGKAAAESDQGLPAPDTDNFDDDIPF